VVAQPTSSARPEAIVKKIAPTRRSPSAALEAVNKGVERAKRWLVLEASYFGLCAAT